MTNVGSIAIKLIMKSGEKIRMLREKREWSQAELGERVGVSQVAILKVENGRTTKSRFLPEIAKALGVSMDDVNDDPDHGGLGGLRQKAEVTMPSYLPSESKTRIPILGVSTGKVDGEMLFDGEPIEWVNTPDYLIGVRDAYCVYVVGESMAPRYRPGDRLDIHPLKPPRREDDVVVQLRPDDDNEFPRGFIKEYVTQTPTTLVLLQLNPQKEIEIPLDKVLSVHFVAGKKSRT